MVDTRRVRIVVARSVFVGGFVLTLVALAVGINSAGSRTTVVLAVIALVLVLCSLPFCSFKPPPRPK